MLIEYIASAPLGDVGDIADVPDDQACVLIKLNLAKAYEKPKPKPKPRQTKTTEPDLLE